MPCSPSSSRRARAARRRAAGSVSGRYELTRSATMRASLATTPSSSAAHVNVTVPDPGERVRGDQGDRVVRARGEVGVDLIPVARRLELAVDARRARVERRVEARLGDDRVGPGLERERRDTRLRRADVDRRRTRADEDRRPVTGRPRRAARTARSSGRGRQDRSRQLAGLRKDDELALLGRLGCAEAVHRTGVPGIDRALHPAVRGLADGGDREHKRNRGNDGGRGWPSHGQHTTRACPCYLRRTSRWRKDQPRDRCARRGGLVG